MQQNPTNFFVWTQKYSTQEACLEDLSRRRYIDGFICPKCSHDNSYQLKYHHLHECVEYGRQVSATAGTVFELTRLPLTKWYAVIYFMDADKGWNSMQRLSITVGFSCPIGYPMTRILRRCRKDPYCVYWLKGLVEAGDAFIDSYKLDKRSRETDCKRPVFFAVDQIENGMGFMAARLLECVNSEQVLIFVNRIFLYSEIRTDALKVFWVLVELDRHLQEYIDEIVFRFNRRFWEFQLPDRLLQTAVDYVPIRVSLNST